jgi:hypothetical protein
MTSSTKILVNMVINFVDKTLLPILDTKIIETARVIEQWSQLKKFVNESNGCVTGGKVEKYGGEGAASIVTPQIPRLTI